MQRYFSIVEWKSGIVSKNKRFDLTFDVLLLV